jgi:integrase
LAPGRSPAAPHIKPKQDAKIKSKAKHTQYKAARHDAILGKFNGHYPINRVTPEVIVHKTDIGAKWNVVPKEAEARLLYAQAVFKMAAARYGLKGNPADKDHLLLTGMLSKHQYTFAPRRGVPLEHAARFMKAIRESEDNSYRKTGRLVTSLWMEMVLLTGVRPMELGKARWKEFDRRKMIWNVPPEHRKKGYITNQILPRPITGPMENVLKEMWDRRDNDPRYDIKSDDDLVFPSPPPEKKNKLFGETALRRYINSLNFEIDGVIYDGKTRERTINPHGAREMLMAFFDKHSHYAKDILRVQLDQKHDMAMDNVYGWRRRSSVDPNMDQPNGRRAIMERWGRDLNGPQPHSAAVLELSKRRKASR